MMSEKAREMSRQAKEMTDQILDWILDNNGTLPSATTTYALGIAAARIMAVNAVSREQLVDMITSLADLIGLHAMENYLKLEEHGRKQMETPSTH